MSHRIAASDSPWRDAAIVMGVTLLGLMVSVHFQLSEALFVETRAFEHLDLDEWPAALLVLSMSLIWM